MAVVRFNNRAWDGALSTPTTYTGLVGPSSYLTPVVDRLDIYKGTMPSWSTFTNASSRSSDLLVSISLGTSSQSTSWLSTGYRIQLAITSNEGVASQSGLATWFLLRNYYQSSDDLTMRGAIMGTVGITGSGADLEVPDTNIVSGSSYRSGSFYITFPLEFTV